VGDKKLFFSAQKLHHCLRLLKLETFYATPTIYQSKPHISHKFLRSYVAEKCGARAAAMVRALVATRAFS
jgi:hypothetical protein